jgi:SAM-dependent methyltransferase
MDSNSRLRREQAVRDSVREVYADIVTGRKARCCSGRRAAPAGYDPADLALLPDGANMGLSCGNPLAAADLREGQIVLDLGSGGGFDAFQAGVKVRAAGRVIGVDMTPEMLRVARNGTRQYRERTGLDNVEFRPGEIEHLPVADNSIDVVLSNCVINLSPDKARVWREIYRVLKPGGRVSIADLALLKPLPLSVASSAKALAGCVAGAVFVEETRGDLEKTGFRSVVLRPEPEYMCGMRHDPLYKKIAEGLPSGENLEDYVVGLRISAEKQAMTNVAL